MQSNNFDLLIHLLGEPRYEANCTLAAAHGCVAYMDVGEGREQGAVSFATHWNRQKIAPAFSAYSLSMDINNFPRRGALPCTTASAHFASSNCGF